MSNRHTPRHLRPVLDRTTPRPADYALAWRTVHGDRHWPAVTRVEARTQPHTRLDDLFTTRPIPVVRVALGGAA